jgi:hypothetical protein
VPELTRLLARALRALGEAGHPVRASRLAAAGWALLRHERPGDAERLTGLLHYLARLPADAAPAKPEPRPQPAVDGPRSGEDKEEPIDEE